MNSSPRPYSSASHYCPTRYYSPSSAPILGTQAQRGRSVAASRSLTAEVVGLADLLLAGGIELGCTAGWDGLIVAPVVLAVDGFGGVVGLGIGGL